MRYGFIIFINLFVVLFTSCKKEAGPGGKNSISGTILYKNAVSAQNDAAPGATVFIAYGTSESTSEFDQSILTDASGKFNIQGLRKGNYFIKAGYTDTHGFVYNTYGYSVELRNKKNNIEINIVLE